MLDEVALLVLSRAFACGHADDTFAAAALRAKCTDGGALDEAAVRNADDAAFVRDEIFHVNLTLVPRELGQARRPVLIANFAQLLLDDRENALFLRQNVLQIFDRVDQLFVFFVDLFPLEPRQLIKAKIENLIRLMLAKSVAAFHQSRRVADNDADLLDLPFRKFKGEQFDARLVAVGRSTNDPNEFVEIFERNQVTFERFGALFRLAQFETRAAQHHFASMLDVGGVRFFEREQFGSAMIDRQHDHGE